MTDMDHKAVDTEGVSKAGGADNDDPNLKHIWLIPVDMTHIKSMCGIVQCVIIGISLLAWICCSASTNVGCDELYGGSYSFFEFCVGSIFLSFVLWYIMFLVTLNQRLRVVPWRLGEMIILGFFGILLFISCIVLALRTCGQGGLKAGVVFGFLLLIPMGAHFYLSFKVWRETEVPATPAGGSAAAQDTEASRY